ncbi:MAG: phosphonate ABC transporter, permease protein PhnE [Leptolyngbyaceae cyanobacterium]
MAVLIYAGQKSELSFVELAEGSGNMAEYISRYFPPDFTDWRFYLSDILETIGMGVWGTLMAAVIAVPLAIMAAENVAPVWLVFIIRRFMDAMRAINEVVFALIFVVAVGLGPFAGVLALFVHTAGTLGKLFSEAIEAIDPGPVEGIRATGASKLQEIIFGVIPQVIPLWTSFTLYRFEANVRSASVLGIVGAGGIGVSLYQSFRAFKYGKVSAILIILIVAVALIDTVSAKIRQRLV